MQNSHLPNELLESGYSVDAGVLAGGQGLRMGGIDKGLKPFRSKHLLSPIIDALIPFAKDKQVIINCNRSFEEYSQFSNRLCSDETPEFLGPMAGMASILKSSEANLVLIAPCDTPFLNQEIPQTLLRHALYLAKNNLTVPPLAIRSGGRLHPTICCLPRSILPRLDEALKAGHFKLGRWFSEVGGIEINYDQAEHLTNLNTEDEVSHFDLSL